MRSAAECSSQSPTEENTAPTAPPEFTGGRKQKVNGKSLLPAFRFAARPTSGTTYSRPRKDVYKRQVVYFKILYVTVQRLTGLKKTDGVDLSLIHIFLLYVTVFLLQFLF